MGCLVSWNKPQKKKKTGDPTSSLTQLNQSTQRSASPQPNTDPRESPQVSQIPPTASNNKDLLPSPPVGRVGFPKYSRPPVRNLDTEISPNNASQAFVYGSPPRHSPQPNMPYYSPSHPIDVPHRYSPHSGIVPFQNPPYRDDAWGRYSPHHYPSVPTGYHYPNPNHIPPSHSPSQGSLYSTQRQQNAYPMTSHFPPPTANRSDHSAPFFAPEQQVSDSQLKLNTSPSFDPASGYPMSSLPFPIYDQAESPSPRSFNNRSHSSILGLDLQPEQARSPTSSSGSLPRDFPRRGMTTSTFERHNDNYNRGTNSPRAEGNRSTSRPESPACSVRQHQDGKVFISIRP